MPAERRQCFFSSPNNRNEQQYFSISAGAGAANGEFTVLYNKYFNGNIPVELLKPLLDAIQSAVIRCSVTPKTTNSLRKPLIANSTVN